MTPAARIQSAIEILDRIFAGEAAERALTAWARASRFAGSKDRAAIRDHVFDALRRLRSAAWHGGLGEARFGDLKGRAVMAGLLSGQGSDPTALFDGSRHGPAPLAAPLPKPQIPPRAVALDCPDWLMAPMNESLGPQTDAVLEALRHRAPVILRANLAQTTAAELIDRFAADGLRAMPHAAAPSAIVVEGAPRGLTTHSAYLEGAFEMQDAGSQALVDRLPLVPEGRVLDLCAGGGGKTLALAARGQRDLMAHDAEPARMRDLPVRAARAGAAIALSERPEEEGLFAGVIADVPCSGAGSWRRAPEAKWRLAPERLKQLTALQDDILDRAVALAEPGGWIAYMTCSLLRIENETRADAAMARHDLLLEDRWSCTPLDGCDGFHLSLLRKP